MASILFSCRSVQTKKVPGLCFVRDNFSQPVEKVFLRDVNKIKTLNDKFVEIEGVLSYNFEDVALYPTNSSDPGKAIWLELIVPETVSESLLYDLSGKEIVVIGKVNLKRKGHLGGYIGTLDSAFCVKIK